jgi:hypothetical protein
VALGDLAVLEYEGRRVVAQAYDIGPTDSERVEISVEACRQLGIPSCARSGGTADGVDVVVLPGSRRMVAEDGKVRPWTADNVARISFSSISSMFRERPCIAFRSFAISTAACQKTPSMSAEFDSRLACNMRS